MLYNKKRSTVSIINLYFLWYQQSVFLDVKGKIAIKELTGHIHNPPPIPITVILSNGTAPAKSPHFHTAIFYPLPEKINNTDNINMSIFQTFNSCSIYISAVDRKIPCVILPTIVQEGKCQIINLY